MSQIIRSQLGGNKVDTWAAEILRQKGANPELINDSVHTAPSKRLEKHTNYKKTINGHQIALSIGLNKLRESCKGFDAWLNQIENLPTSNDL